MFQKFLANFRQLPSSNISMVYLTWIYHFGAIITNIFSSIYVYTVHESLITVVVYHIVSFIFIFIGFTWLWVLATIYSWNTKNFFTGAFFLYIFALINILFFWETFLWIFLYGALNGIWIWMYWNAIHTQELANVIDSDRDFYSSSVSFWKNIFSVFSPFLAAIFFSLWVFFNIDGYKLLFSFLLLIYLYALLFIKKIDNYVPQKISRDDITNFCNFRIYKFWNMFFFFDWAQNALITAILPIIMIILLHSEINIWIYNSILWIISVYFIGYFSLKRSRSSRFYYFSLFWLLMSVTYLIFWVVFDLYGFIVFSFLNILFYPLLHISQHVYALRLMDSVKTQKNDFYPAMLFRETILFFWRILSLWVLLLFLTQLWIWEELALRWWVFAIAFLFILLIVSIYYWKKFEK